jgi:hypothetical protein
VQRNASTSSNAAHDRGVVVDNGWQRRHHDFEVELADFDFGKVQNICKTTTTNIQSSIREAADIDMDVGEV